MWSQRRGRAGLLAWSVLAGGLVLAGCGDGHHDFHHHRRADDVIVVPAGRHYERWHDGRHDHWRRDGGWRWRRH